MTLRSQLLTGVAGVAVVSAAAWVGLADPLPPGLSCTGACGQLGPDGVVTPSPSGSSTYFYVTTAGGQTGVGQLPGVGGTNGSLLQTDVFFAKAGAELQYYFNYVTSDGSGFADYAFSQLTSAENGTFTLFSARTKPSGDISPGFGLPLNDATLTPPTTQIQSGTAWSALGASSGTCYAAGCGHTGWVSATYVIQQEGWYSLRFGVSNFGDSAYQSGLAFDGITVDGVSVVDPVQGCLVTPGNDACFINAATDQTASVDALTGTDTLRLGGATDFDFDVSTLGAVFSNFELFAKAGTSTVTLTGVAAVAANWTVELGKLIAGGPTLAAGSRVNVLASGQLELNADTAFAALEGAGQLNLGASTLTVGAGNTDTTFSGVISGTGKVVKTGTGLLTLSGNNTFSGGIDILHGGIGLGSNTAAGAGSITTFGSLIDYANGVNSAAPVVIASNTTQFQVLTGSAEQSGVISQLGGARPFEKIGAGELVLSAANTFTGTTTVTNGTLTVRGSSALDDAASVAIASAGTLRIDDSETVGLVAGSGNILLDPGATLTLGGTNASALFAGDSSGAGNITKTGTGAWQLTGDNAFSGLLNVAQGVVAVLPSGTLANMSLQVATGASLLLGGSPQGTNGGGATGTGLGAMSVANGGTLYLDDNTSLGGSSLALAAGSNLNLFLAPSTTQYPQITVGSANVTGANLGVYLEPLDFAGTAQTVFVYDNVIASSNVTGALASSAILSTASPLFSLSTSTDAGGINIRLERLAFGDIIPNPSGNQSSLGAALEQIFVGGVSDPDLLNVFGLLATGNLSDIVVLYSGLSGSVAAEATQAMVRTDDPFRHVLAERMNITRSPGCTVAGDTWCLRRYAQATPQGPVMSDVQGDPTVFDWLQTGVRDTGTVSVWGRALAAWSEMDGSDNAPGSRQRSYGFVAGSDKVVDASLLVGIAAQYVQTDVDHDSGNARAELETLQLGGYVSYGGAETYLNGSLSANGSQGKSQRRFAVGATDYSLSSFQRSWAASASAEVGKVIEADGMRLEPSMGLRYVWMSTGDYAESGGGGLGLLIRPDASQSLRSAVGARLSRVFELGDRKIVPQLRVEWQHEFLDRGQSFEAAFAAAPGIPFRVEGTNYTRDQVALGLSVTMPLTGNLTGYADGQTSFSDDMSSTMLSLGLRATW